MRTVAQETAPQIALRDCSKKAAGEDLYKITRFYTIYKILVKGEFNALKHLLYKRFSASHEELMSP